jgi:hypothetical protein
MITWGYSLAGLVVGTAVGATGVGGGSLMTPILILFYGVSPAMAVGTDLLYASISKSFGTWLHNRNQSVDWRIVGWMALGSLPASLLTLVMLEHIGNPKTLDHLIKIVLSCAIVATATFTLIQDQVMVFARRRNGNGGVHRPVDPRYQRTLTVLSGLLIGSMVTISSVGAGAIGMMLLMMMYPRHEPISLVGSDLAHAVLITAIAGIGHARLGTVDYSMLLFLLVGAIPGIWVGSQVGFRLDARALKRVIAVLLIVVGGMTLAKAMQVPVATVEAAQQNPTSVAR